MTEYKVVTLPKTMTLGKMADALQETLNTHAKLGWKLKHMEGLFVILEKD